METLKMDWKKISDTTDQDNLSDQEKDNLYTIIAWFDINQIKLDKYQLVHLFKVTQDIVKYKGEQVETLIAELDELAERQGEEEIKLQTTIKDKISVSSTDNFKEENEQLKRKNHDQEKYIEKLKKELTKLSREVSNLEQQKMELQNELQDAQNSDQDSSEYQAPDERYNALVESLHQKNKHISKLLNDIEVTEKENKRLSDKLDILRDELEDATKNMNQVTEELTGLKLLNQHNGEKIDSLIQENNALRGQIEELVKQKEQRDIQIDEFSAALDKRIDDWKQILEDKNTEIEEWKTKYLKLSKETPKNFNIDSNRYIELMKTVEEREDKIEELQNQLEEATKDMTETVLLIDKLKAINSTKINIDNESNIIDKLRLELKESNDQIEELRSSLLNAEEDARIKSKEVNELILQVQKYESGEFGLSEAVANIQELKKKIYVRDKQIQMLVQSLNQLKTETEQIEEQNLLLRQKCGLGDSPIRSDGIALKQRKQKQLIIKLQSQINKLNEEKIELKLNTRNLNETLAELKKQLNEAGFEPNISANSLVVVGKDQVDYINELDACHSEKLRELVIENEALRKGLQEVLNSIQEQAGQSTIEVKSQVLERLIKMLDVRNVAGWYTPAMRLQAELHSLQGGNAELREQLKSARLENIDSLEQLQKVKAESEILKSQLSKSTGDFDYDAQDTIRNLEFSEDAFSSARTIPKTDIPDLLTEYNIEKEKNKELLEKIDELQTELNNFESENNKLQVDTEILTEQLKELKTYVTTEYENDDQVKITERLDLIAELITFRRKCLYLEEKEIKLNVEIVELKENELKYKTLTTQQIINLQNTLEKHELENTYLKNSLNEMIPLNKYSNLEQQLLDMTLKYRQIIDQINNNNNEHNYLEKIEHLEHLIQSEYTDIISNDNLEIKLQYEIKRAINLNHLLEINKDQLKSYEQRIKDFESEINMLKMKNIELQTSLNEVQDQSIKSVSEELYNTISNEKDQLLKELEMLRIDMETIKKNYLISEENLNCFQQWKTVSEQELIGLKHLIVDLQAVSDDKAIIAKLNFDIEILRKKECEYLGTIELLQQEKNLFIEEKANLKNINNKSEQSDTKILSELKIKNRNLKNIIFSLRHQYLGSVPLLVTESYINKLNEAKNAKQLISKKLQDIKEIEYEMNLTKEELVTKMEFVDNLKTWIEDRNIANKILDWYQERSELTIQELKARRLYEFKDLQLQQALTKLQEQEDEIIKLEEHLLRQVDYGKIYDETTVKPEPQKVEILHKPIPAPRKLSTIEITTQTDSIQMQHVEVNTEIVEKTPEKIEEDEIMEEIIEENIDINENKESKLYEIKLLEKTKEVEDCNKKILEITEELHNLRKDLALKQEEILINRTPERKLSDASIDIERNGSQIKSMKGVIVNLQQLINDKDEIIQSYEGKLKEMKDEHSRAAARMQDEVQKLQAALLDKQQLQIQEIDKIQVPEAADVAINQKAVEHYMRQVHTMEAHVGELHTALRVLDTQLTSSRQEAIRWRTLADDRLFTMDQLQSRLEAQHQSEIEIYKKEWERWRDEAGDLKLELSKARMEIREEDTIISKTIHEKDFEIHDLNRQINDLQVNLKAAIEKNKIMTTLENSMGKQMKQENESLKKQMQAIKAKEKEAREEIRSLRGQLINRPILTARSDRGSSGRVTVREQRLQKKISALEEELDDTRQKLDQQVVINESRRAKNIEGLQLWNKQKHWQQTAEKFKEKLKIKTEEYEKVQQSYLMSKNIINRLEREKNVLEIRLKSAKGSQIFVEDNNRIELLEHENAKLQMEIESLNNKLEMCHRHSGGLGAAMLEEKLEAQERKIAVLELTSKTSTDITDEIERLQCMNNRLQKENMQLEALNLELKIDLEKIGSETPRLRDQIEHLQRYIDVLKLEKIQQPPTTQIIESTPALSYPAQNKKIADLEKTLFVMKRVVEKLQMENKRLVAGKPQLQRDRKDCEERLKSELYRTREQYKESLQTITRLEQELSDAKKHILFLENSITPEKPDTKPGTDSELDDVRMQLKQKNELLEKVKILLHRAAAKEKALDEQVKTLRSLIPQNNSSQEGSEPSNSAKGDECE